MRPPTRSRASRTVARAPCNVSRRAALRPAGPPPTTTTRGGRPVVHAARARGGGGGGRGRGGGGRERDETFGGGDAPVASRSRRLPSPSKSPRMASAGAHRPSASALAARATAASAAREGAGIFDPGLTRLWASIASRRVSKVPTVTHSAPSKAPRTRMRPLGRNRKHRGRILDRASGAARRGVSSRRDPGSNPTSDSSSETAGGGARPAAMARSARLARLVMRFNANLRAFRAATDMFSARG